MFVLATLCFPYTETEQENDALYGILLATETGTGIELIKKKSVSKDFDPIADESPQNEIQENQSTGDSEGPAVASSGKAR